MRDQARWLYDCHLRYKARKSRERLMMWIAWHLPRDLVMWCYIRVGANATTGKYEREIVPEVRMMDALQRWTEK